MDGDLALVHTVVDRYEKALEALDRASTQEALWASRRFLRDVLDQAAALLVVFTNTDALDYESVSRRAAAEESGAVAMLQRLGEIETNRLGMVLP